MKRTFKQFLENQEPEKHEARPDWLSKENIEHIWDEANEQVFGGQLNKSWTKISIEDDLEYLNRRFPHNEEKRDGKLVAYCDKEGSKYILRFCGPMLRDARDMMEVTVHEMVHQAEAERIGYLNMCKDPHGPGFFAWADSVHTYHNIVLKEHQ